jgi:carbon monoxide dehydrogenase subunit G
VKVAGQATLHAPIDRVWQALNDPAVLVRTIPGCLRLEATGQDAYAMTVTAGVASIKGTYAGTVQLAELHEPNSFVMRASGAGGPGTVNADVTVRLTERGASTELVYDADAVVGGMIGGVGQRMLVGVAKKLAGEFFAGVDDVLTGRAGQPPAGPVLAAGTIAGEVAAPPGPQAGVYLAPSPALPHVSEGLQFMLGAAFGAAAALLGVLVGARTARTRRGD